MEMNTAKMGVPSLSKQCVILEYRHEVLCRKQYEHTLSHNGHIKKGLLASHISRTGMNHKFDRQPKKKNSRPISEAGTNHVVQKPIQAKQKAILTPKYSCVGWSKIIYSYIEGLLRFFNFEAIQARDFDIKDTVLDKRMSDKSPELFWK